MKKMRVFAYVIVLVLLFSVDVGAEFNFNTTTGGSDEFVQQIEDGEEVTVGIIPENVNNLYVSLECSDDVDIRLYDSENNKAIVGWSIGATLKSDDKCDTKYNGVTITYSGYNGYDGEKGHEYISISGVTSNEYRITAFGFDEGYATVIYSYDGTGSGDTSGTGYFEKHVSSDEREYVGTIPAGVENFKVYLEATNDLDIELYNGNNDVVGWGDRFEISSGSKVTDTYRNDVITWSGWNGDGSGKGNEYIKISGTSMNEYKLYVFGFEEGKVEVSYSWDGMTTETNPNYVDEKHSKEVENGFVMIVEPKDLYIDVVKEVTWNISGDFINGGFFNTGGKTSGTLLISNGKILNERNEWEQDHDPLSHFIVDRNGNVSVKTLNYTPSVDEVRFAITGFTLFPDGQSLKESIKDEYNTTGYYSSDYRSALGYNESLDKVMLFIFTEKTSAKEMKDILLDNGCTIGIGLDGGGSTIARFEGQRYYAVDPDNDGTDSRRIHHVIRWE